MAEPRGLSFSVPPGEGLPAARSHYAAGVGYLIRIEAASTAESRIRCAATAAAYFAAGQLALAIDAAGHAEVFTDD